MNITYQSWDHRDVARPVGVRALGRWARQFLTRHRQGPAPRRPRRLRTRWPRAWTSGPAPVSSCPSMCHLSPRHAPHPHLIPYIEKEEYFNTENK